MYRQNKQRSTFFRFLGYAKPYRLLILATIGIGVVGMALNMAFPMLTSMVIDRVIPDGEGVSAPELDATAVARRLSLLNWILVAAVVVAIGRAVATFFRGYLSARIGNGVIFDVRQALWGHLQRLSLSYYDRQQTGNILSRLINDINTAQQMTNGGVIQIALDAATALLILGLLVYIEPLLAAVTMIVMPFYFIAYHRLRPQIRQASRDVQAQMAKISGNAQERLAGIAIVQSFAAEGHERRQFHAENSDHFSKVMTRVRYSHFLSGLSALIISGGTVIVLYLGGFLALKGALSAGNVVAFILYVGMMYGPLERLAEINTTIQTSLAAVERVFAVFDIVPEVRSRPDAIAELEGPGELTFDHIDFEYIPRRPVLRGIDLKISAGEKVALVGPSGAGKSTFAGLIPRLYDVSEGAIRIDGIDVRDIHLKTLRRNIGIVLQDPFLFNGTVRENLRYGRKQATNEQVIDAAIAANAHSFIEELPEGYETVVGERGVTLSGGQKQRLSLARTILKDPKILILDEATSSLDSESENLIQDAMSRLLAGRTALIIAHRLSTIVGVDRILVVNQGQIVEQGGHVDLLSRGGLYAKLLQQQFGPLHALVNAAARSA